MRHQRTLKGVIGCEGITLHAGTHSEVVIRPAPANSGIRFIRSDFDDSSFIQAHAKHVSDTFYSTTIGSGDTSVSTIEHLMAAFFGMGIDNAEVHIRGSEVPILDGSSREWVALIEQVGIQTQSGRKVPELVIRKPVGVKAQDHWATLFPSDIFSVECEIDFEHPAIGRQSWEGVVTPKSFRTELSDARTFGLLKDVDYLRSRGRARGASMANAIVLDDRTVVSPGGLRYKNEFARHKVLDAVGDLSLLGFPIRGRLVSHRAGHKVHQQLLKVLLESPDCWEFSCDIEQGADRAIADAERSIRLIS